MKVKKIIVSSLLGSLVALIALSLSIFPPLHLPLPLPPTIHAQPPAVVKVESKAVARPDEIETIHISVSGVPDPGLKNMQVGPQGALNFDPNVIKIIDIYGVNSYIAYSHTSLDEVNRTGRLKFTATKFKSPYLTEGDIVAIEVKAVGKAGDSTPLEITQIDMLRDAEGNDITYTTQSGEFSIASGNPPVAEFDFFPERPEVGQTVEFIDLSYDPDPEGEIVSWSWDFGDGTTSSEQNPKHQYAQKGIFVVKLVVTDDTKLKSEPFSREIKVAIKEPTADFTFQPEEPTTQDTVHFTDKSSDPDGKVVKWEWDFGDGGTSTRQNPTHRYLDDGEYEVTLIVTDDDGARSEPVAKTIVVANVPPVSDFSFSPPEPFTTDTVRFKDQSEDPDGKVISWRWDFGDGGTSTEQHPTHQYAKPGTYTVKLTVTDDDGAKATVSKEITVALNRPPTADFTFQPEEPTTQDTVHFTDKSTDPDGEVVSWEWDFGDGTTSSERNPTHRYVDDGTYKVTLTVTDNNGARSEPVAKTIVVANVPPVSDFSFSPPTPSTLDTIEFTDRSYDPDGEVVSWEWDFGDGTTSTERNPKHRYPDNGEYEVTLIVTDDDGARSEPVAKTIVVANVPPVSDFSFSPPTPSTLDTIEFTDRSYDPDGEVVSWEWNFGDGTTSVGKGPTHKYSKPGTYTVRLTVTDNDGATSSIAKSITVSNVWPKAAFSFSPGRPTTRDTIRFTDQSVDPDGTIISWKWDFGDGNVSTEQNPIYKYSRAGTYKVTLTVTDDQGAKDSVSRKITVELGAGPSASFVFSPEEPRVGETIQFKDQSSHPNGVIISWHWDFGDGSISREKDPTHEYLQAGTYKVTLTVTDDQGVMDSFSRKVEVKPRQPRKPPRAMFTFSPERPRVGEPVQFSDNSTDEDGIIVSWFWDFGDGSPVSTERNPTHQYEEAGTFTVELKVVDDDGLIGRLSKEIVVTPCAIGFEFSPLRPKAGEIVQFKGMSDPSCPQPISWFWEFGDGTTSTGRNPTHRYSSAGTFSVTLTVTYSDGTTEKVSKEVTIVPPEEPGVHVHNSPNPARDKTTFIYVLPEGAGKAVLRVFDITGKLVFHHEVTGREYTWNLKSDAGTDLPDGPYFYYIIVYDADGKRGARSKIGKLVIQR